MTSNELKLILEFVSWLAKQGINIPWQYVALFQQEKENK